MYGKIVDAKVILQALIFGQNLSKIITVYYGSIASLQGEEVIANYWQVMSDGWGEWKKLWKCWVNTFM